MTVLLDHDAAINALDQYAEAIAVLNQLEDEFPFLRARSLTPEQLKFVRYLIGKQKEEKSQAILAATVKQDLGFNDDEYFNTTNRLIEMNVLYRPRLGKPRIGINF